MAVLAVLALTEAGLAVCPSAQAHAHAMAENAAAPSQMHSAHPHHVAAPHGEAQEASDCHEPAPAQKAAIEGHCPDCAGGMSCGECALLTAVGTGSFEADAPHFARRHQTPFAVLAADRRPTFDPPPPKA